MNTLSLVIILLIVLVVMGMVGAIFLSQQVAKKQRTMAVIKGQSAGDGDKKNDKDSRDKRRAEIARKLKETGELEAKKKKTGTRAYLQQAGLKTSVQQYWLFSLLLGVGLPLAVKVVLGWPMPVAICLFVVGLLGVPRLVLKRMIARRQKKFLEEFGDALEAIVRLLKAGMPVTEAIAMASREFEGPVGEEMAMIYDAQKIGVPLPEATLEAAQRMPITEMQMFATGIAIQTQTGASLSEVLTNLAGVIRARFKLKRKVIALSSEAKASAMIIGSLPFLVGTALYFMNKEFIMLLFTTTPGKIMTVCGFVWMSIGILVMKMMINFKV